MTMDKDTRKKIRRAVKHLYGEAYGLASENYGPYATSMLKETNEALQVLNETLGLNIKTKGRSMTILETLNSYEGAQIWQDVIYDMLSGEEWDAAPDSSDEFTHDGIIYRHEPSLDKWVARCN